MARPRKHQSNAKRQAAYRQRTRQAIFRQLEAKGLPALPAIPTIPGWSRWNQAIQQAGGLVTQVQSEMEDYYDDRSETWQDSDQGKEFQERLQDVSDVLDAVSNWLT